MTDLCLTNGSRRKTFFVLLIDLRNATRETFLFKNKYINSVVEKTFFILTNRCNYNVFSASNIYENYLC